MFERISVPVPFEIGRVNTYLEGRFRERGAAVAASPEAAAVIGDFDGHLDVLEARDRVTCTQREPEFVYERVD